MTFLFFYSNQAKIEAAVELCELGKLIRFAIGMLAHRQARPGSDAITTSGSGRPVLDEACQRRPELSR
jgi:hypothetical protein